LVLHGPPARLKVLKPLGVDVVHVMSVDLVVTVLDLNDVTHLAGHAPRALVVPVVMNADRVVMNVVIRAASNVPKPRA
jgi:hypothetical protein